MRYHFFEAHYSACCLIPNGFFIHTRFFIIITLCAFLCWFRFIRFCLQSFCVNVSFAHWSQIPNLHWDIYIPYHSHPHDMVHLHLYIALCTQRKMQINLDSSNQIWINLKRWIVPCLALSLILAPNSLFAASLHVNILKTSDQLCDTEKFRDSKKKQTEFFF